MVQPAEQTHSTVSRSFFSEALRRFRPVVRMAFRRISWRWLALILLPALTVPVADATGADWLVAKSVHEQIAVPILGIAFVLWVMRAARERSVFIALVAAQVLAFMMREIHFRGTGEGVYVATAIIGLLMVRLAWRTDWEARLPKVDWGLVTALAVTVASYALAILVQRRVFKGLPGERHLHIAFEETMETGSHLLFLASSFVRRRVAAKADDCEPVAE